MARVTQAVWLIVMAFGLFGPSVCSAGSEEARGIMERVEANQQIAAEAVEFEMVLTDRTGFQRRREVREFRQRLEDLEASLVFFDDPPDIRGSALLSKERADGWDDQWLYLPAVGKIRRIAESGRTDYFLGTDLTFEDFSVEDIDRFSYKMAGPDTEIVGRRSRVIDAVSVDTASRRRSGYGLRRVYVDAERYVILRTDYFGRSDRLLKTLRASDVVSYELQIPNPKSEIPNPRKIWRADRIFVDNFDRNHSTDILVTRRALSDGLPRDLFTPRTLRRGVVPEIFQRRTKTSP